MRECTYIYDREQHMGGSGFAVLVFKVWVLVEGLQELRFGFESDSEF